MEDAVARFFGRMGKPRGSHRICPPLCGRQDGSAARNQCIAPALVAVPRAPNGRQQINLDYLQAAGATPAVSSWRTPPSRLRALARSRASACGPTAALQDDREPRSPYRPRSARWDGLIARHGNAGQEQRPVLHGERTPVLEPEPAPPMVACCSSTVDAGPTCTK